VRAIPTTLGLALLLGLASPAAAQTLPAIGNTGTWQYRADYDGLTRSTVYVAEYANLTSAIRLRCGRGGAFLFTEIGIKTEGMTQPVALTFYFPGNRTLTNPMASKHPLTLTASTNGADNAIPIGGERTKLLLDALALYEETSVTLSDPAGIVPERHGTFPLTGAADAIRNVYRNCDQLKGQTMPGADPAWRLLDEADQQDKQKTAPKP
jgi:hypothetical protein